MLHVAFVTSARSLKNWLRIGGKVINQIETAFIEQNQQVAGIAENLANYHVYYGDANLINTEMERYRAVTAADVLRVANQYLVKENRVVLYYLPQASN